MHRQIIGAGLVSLALLLHAPVVRAQQQEIRGQVRGQVVDAAAKGIQGVAVEMVLEGKHPRTITLTTDKKGGYVRVGIPEGNWKLTFRKEGFKPAATTLWISLGGISEVPPVTLHPLGELAPTAAPATGAPQSAGGEAGAAAAKPAEIAAVKDLFDKANAAIGANRWDDAESLLKEAGALAPDLFAVHYNLGWVYEHKNNLTDAANEYRRAKELDATRADTHLGLARVLVASGQQDEAKQVLDAAGAQFGQDPLVQLNIGINAFNAGLPEQAGAAFEKAQALDPANPEPLYFLSMLELQKGQLAAAIAQIEKYIGLTGQNPENLARAKAMLAELRKASPKR
jgi:Tfp pilus assembly protein PilF